jgi:hypothetical protein
MQNSLFLFWRLSALVNADRVNRKLPSLLVEGSTTKKKSWNSLMCYRYRIAKFKKNNPEKFNTLANKLIFDLTELEKAVSA